MEKPYIYMKILENHNITISNQPLISIITVVLNSVHTLETAIKSVLSQKINNHEYIIVDGGSVDGTIEIIRKYESQLACWISEPDKGVYDAMNKAVSIARGKWLYFLGADDQLLKDFNDVSNYLKDDKTLYYGHVYRPRVDRIYDGKFSGYKLACRNICHQSVFYPAYIWGKYAYDTKYRIMADYELNLRCFADPEIKFHYFPKTVALFTDKGGISSSGVDTEFEKVKLSLAKEVMSINMYRIFVVRTFILHIFERLRLKKLCTHIYHASLRFKPGYLKEKNRIKK